MKTNLFFFLFFAVAMSAFAQYRPAVVGLKSGDSITGIVGDIQRKAFKYKSQAKGNSKKIDLSEIDFVKLLYSEKDVRTYRFFQLEDDEKYTQLQLLSTGKNAELYSKNFYAQSSFGAAGAPMGQEVVKYYVKRPSEKDLTFLGIYDPIPNTLRDKVISYVSDCPELVEQILNRDFRIRNGLAPIFEFYNKSCNSI